MKPYYQDGPATIYEGDCIEVMRELPEASVDAVVTDPPYGLEFMGREWDGADGFRRSLNVADAGRDSVFGRTSRTSPEYRADSTFQMWCEAWASEALRVLKPGGHLLAFGGSRTWHRLTAGIEDAGFEVRDSIAWLYGSGFPKSRNLDGEWEGWGTALKPAFEPVVVARKPLVGTVAANVLAHGTGALNIAAARVGRRDGDRTEYGRDRELPHANTTASLGKFDRVTAYTPDAAGRWPANVVLDESQADALDQQSGMSKDGIAVKRNGVTSNGVTGWGKAPVGTPDMGYGGQGGASRFFYVAKADSSERPEVDGVQHPTVKPIDLMRWLVRLVTPPNGVVLEPFAGSGSTVEACIREGFSCIAIEREAAYLPLIMQRIRKPHEQTLFV